MESKRQKKLRKDRELLISALKKFRSIDKVCYITAGVKIYHGCKDELIDLSHPKQLYDCLPNKRWDPTYMPNTGHLDILCKLDYDELNCILNNL